MTNIKQRERWSVFAGFLSQAYGDGTTLTQCEFVILSSGKYTQRYHLLIISYVFLKPIKLTKNNHCKCLTCSPEHLCYFYYKEVKVRNSCKIIFTIDKMNEIF